jgi:hypothetical protein
MISGFLDLSLMAFIGKLIAFNGQLMALFANEWFN